MEKLACDLLFRLQFVLGGLTAIHLSLIFSFQMSVILCVFGLQLQNVAVLLILTCSFLWCLVDEIQFMLINMHEAYEWIYMYCTCKKQKKPWKAEVR